MGMPVITSGTLTREESVADIIESIAIQESAIAHILNAESEKLHRVVHAPCTTPQHLLAVNHSVKNTIDAVTRLEMSLEAKLKLFGPVICQIN